MHSEIIKDFLLIGLTVAYTVTLLMYIIDFFSRKRIYNKLKTLCLIGTAGLHLCSFFFAAIVNHQFPLWSVQDVISTTALMMLLSYLILELILDVKESGGFVVLCAFILQISASFFLRTKTTVSSSEILIDMHLVTIILGYSSIFISGVYSFLYLALLHVIQSNYFGDFFERMPSLETMEKMSCQGAVLGVIIFSLAFIIGFVAILQKKSISMLDPNLIGLLSIWLVYGLSVLLKKRLRMQGKKIAIVFSICFCVALLITLITNFSGFQFHKTI